MSVRISIWSRGILFAAGVALFGPPVMAEPVTYTFTGVVTSVTNGSNGTLNLTRVFANGQSTVFSITVERDIQGIFDGAFGTTVYLSPIYSWTFSIGPYVCPLGPNGITEIWVGNDRPPPPPLNPAGLAGSVVDFYYVDISSPNGPTLTVENWRSRYLIFQLIDQEAAVFADELQPRMMPDVSEFETATWNLSFTDEATNRWGKVAGTFNTVATPATVSTWGRLKAAYK